MPLDINATTKDYTLTIYSKEEIDATNSAETGRVDGELSLKSLKADEGSPSGISTLDSSGKVNLVELPISTILEAGDETNEETLITPYALHYQIGVKTVEKSEIGSANGVAPLGSDNLVPVSYLPPQQIVQTFVVDLLSEMYAITTAKQGDRCVVTDEPTSTDNGEYVASIDYPVDNTGWDQLPNISAVSSVNGQVGDVDITSIVESADNAVRLTATELATTTNAADIATNVTATGLKADQIALDTTNANVATNVTNIGLRATQADLDTATTAIELNTDFRESRTYDYSNTIGFVVANDAYEEVNRLVTPARDAGVYEITLSMIYSLNSTNTAAYFRFSFDGGLSWVEVRKESKDVADKIPSTYTTVDNFAGGIKDIVIQARKENASDVLTVLDQTVIYQRKA